MLRWLTAGESHGQALVGVLEGMPADVAITTADITRELQRRRLGVGPRRPDEVRGRRGPRDRWCPAWAHHGRPGRDRGRQQRVAEVGRGHVVGPRGPDDVLAAQARNAPLTRPRPGHADLAGMQKYGFDESRPILERASARRPPHGSRSGLSRRRSCATSWVRASSVTSWSSVRWPSRRDAPATPADLDAIDADPARCADPETASRMAEEVEAARRDGDTLGGIVEVLVNNLPPGPRLARALGPPSRLTARRRAHGHPGDQGRRGR